MTSELGLVYCAAVWGATFFMVKDALAGVDPVAMVAHRFLLAALVLAPKALRGPGKGRCLKESAVLALFLLLLYASQTVGLAYTSAANSGFITGLFVVFVPVFLLVFRRRAPAAAEWGASALALAGLWLLTGGVSSANAGDALTLVSAAMYAAHLLATDAYVRGDADPLVLAFHQFWMTGLAAAGLTLALGRPLAVTTPAAGATIVFLALVPTLSAFFIQMKAQRTVSPVRVSLIFSLEPAFAAAFAWTLGGEPLRPAAALGGGLIVAAMVAGELGKAGPAPAAA